MNNPQNSLLLLESLEPRWLLSGVWTGTDIDGDKVTIRLSGPGILQVDSQESGLGEQIDVITVFNTRSSSKLTINAARRGGDGYVDIETIDAAGETLNQISVDGNLGYLTARSVKKINVWSPATLSGQDAEWVFESYLKELQIKGDFMDATLDIGGSVNKVTVNGDMDFATLLIGGEADRITVKGDIKNDTLIQVNYELKSLKVYGSCYDSTIETSTDLRRLYVRGDLDYCIVKAGDDIGTIMIDGTMVETSVQAQDFIDKIDVWFWIVDSDIQAGYGGIDYAIAYGISDSAFDSLGRIDDIDLYYFYHDDDDYIMVDGALYWPILTPDDVNPRYEEDYLYYYDDEDYDYYGDFYYYYFE